MSELALQLIEENKRTQNPFLDLGNCGLENEIPKEIATCTWLTNLGLSNTISSSKNEFAGEDLAILEKLPLLQTLSLNYCKITDIDFLRKLNSLNTLMLEGSQIADYGGLKECRQLEHLTLSLARIEDIHFLENLPNLRSLDLSHNQIQDFTPIGKLKHLTSLTLRFSTINNTDFFENLPDLHTLDLWGCKITDLASLEKLPNLENLTLSGIPITNFDFLANLHTLKVLNLRQSWYKEVHFRANLPLLHTLNLSANGITFIKFYEELPSLQVLNLQENHIMSLRFLANMVSLRSLNLHANKIENISFLEKLTTLEELDISRNQVKDMRVLKKLTDLKSLNLGGNQITNVDCLDNHVHLQKLDLSYNQLPDIGFVEKLPTLQELNLNGIGIKYISSLAKLTNLHTLNLYANKIAVISPLAGLINLRSLSLGSNTLLKVDALRNLTNLTTLNLTWSHLGDIRGLENLTNLTSLDLESNQISDITPLRKLTALTELKLSSNKIRDISALAELTRLKTLHLYSNEITTANFRTNLPALESLHLYRNKISDISFIEVLRSLREVYLSDNEISRINFHKILPKITTIDLSNNQVTDISPLEKLPNLSYLRLNNNQIANIDCLNTLDKLTTVEISQNRITAINQIRNLINLPSLASIYCYNNPLPLPAQVKLNDIASLRAYFKDLEKGTTDKRFAKLLFLGDGCVGKTTLYRHLKNETSPKEIDPDDRTHGIDLDIWQNELENLKINVWDFGGQEIFHGTHRLFLGQRAVYVLVWTQQENKKCSKDEQHPLTYWLDFIAEYGQESTVLLVENCIGASIKGAYSPSEATLIALANEFKSRKLRLIPVNYLIDCRNDSNAVAAFGEVLKKEIIQLTQDYYIDEFPVNRLSVIEEIEELKKTEKTIPMAVYEEVCRKHEIESSKQMLDFLTKTGLVSYYSGLSNDTVILQTEWVLEALYEALRIKDNPLVALNGKLSKQDFDTIWKNYTEPEKKLFIHYMLKCELLAQPYRRANNPLKRDYEYLLPALFPACPAHLKLNWKEQETYWVIKFKFLYPSIMQRFQTRILMYCHFKDEESLFKNHLLFTGIKNEKCHIEALEKENEIRIWTDTPDFYNDMFSLFKRIYPLNRVQLIEVSNKAIAEQVAEKAIKKTALKSSIAQPNPNPTSKQIPPFKEDDSTGFKRFLGVLRRLFLG